MIIPSSKAVVTRCCSVRATIVGHLEPAIAGMQPYIGLTTATYASLIFARAVALTVAHLKRRAIRNGTTFHLNSLLEFKQFRACVKWGKMNVHSQREWSGNSLHVFYLTHVSYLNYSERRFSFLLSAYCTCLDTLLVTRKYLALLGSPLDNCSPDLQSARVAPAAPRSASFGEFWRRRARSLSGRRIQSQSWLHKYFTRLSTCNFPESLATASELDVG